MSSSEPVHGDTANLKSSQARALQRFGARQVPPDHVVSAVLARDLLDLSQVLNRQLGLFIDRRGRVQRVILGDAHSLALPEFTRVRGQGGRLRGIRLVVTHLVPDPLTREELALQAAVGPILWLPYAAAGVTAAACRRHAAVQDAVAAGHGAQARAAAEQHVSDLLVAVRELHRQVVCA